MLVVPIMNVFVTTMELLGLCIQMVYYYFLKIHDSYGRKIYVECVVTDDDTEIKKYLTHPSYKKRG